MQKLQKYFLKLLWCVLFCSVSCGVLAQSNKNGKKPEKKTEKKSEVVEMTGISIIGNRELPKTLFIVPWKNTEVGYETHLTNTLDEGMKPVDQEVFVRELDYYEFLHPVTGQ